MTTESHQHLDTRPLVALAGGKSGGHVFPALAVAEELVELGAQVVLFGMHSGMERRLAQERDIPFVAIDAAPLVGAGLPGKVAAVTKLSVNAWRARAQLKRRRVVAVLATGGFVSAPTVLGARLAGIPIVLLEPNAEPGAANRFLSRWANVAAVAFEATTRTMKCPCRVLGVPVRAEFDLAGREAVNTSRLPGAPRLLIVGGSQGAERLNAELPRAVAGSLSQASVLHQCGAGNVDQTVARWRTALGDGARVEESSDADAAETEVVCGDLRISISPFLSDMPRALATADLVVSRAGAITLAELSAAGRPSILVPLPLAGAHQLGNAQRQAELGAAVVIEQDQLDQMGVLLAQLAVDAERLSSMGAAARAAAKPNAARDIAMLTRETAALAGRWAA